MSKATHEAVKEKEKAIWAEINASTIPEEIKALYLLANATDILATQSFLRIKAVFAKNGLITNENDLLKGINKYCQYLKMAATQFFIKIEPQIEGATWGAHIDDDPDGKGSAKAFDNFNAFGNELVRLNLLYIDRTANSQEAYGKVFKTLRQLPSKGIFKDEDISKYRMK